MDLGPIVSTHWLAARIGDPDVIVLDASVEKDTSADGRRRSGRASFEEKGHIPGARFADLLNAFSRAPAPFAFTRPEASGFADAAGALGISKGRTVVAYDNSTNIWAARFWWLMRSFGHENVAVLNGGLTAWAAEGRALEKGPAREWEAARFTADPVERYFTDKNAVRAIVEGSAEGILACVLRPPVFAGIERDYARAGHIPGSVNLPFRDLLGPDNRLLPAEALKQRLAGLLSGHAPIVLYCGGGITAAGTALALQLLGVGNVSIYDGSLAEWSADHSLPMSVAQLPSQSQP